MTIDDYIKDINETYLSLLEGQFGPKNYFSYQIAYDDLVGDSFFDKMNFLRDLILSLKEENFILLQEKFHFGMKKLKNCPPFYFDPKYGVVRFGLFKKE